MRVRYILGTLTEYGFSPNSNGLVTSSTGLYYAMPANIFVDTCLVVPTPTVARLKKIVYFCYKGVVMFV